MTRPAAYRGQPVLLIVAVLVAWSAARVGLWQPPFGGPLAAASGSAPLLVAPRRARVASTARGTGTPVDRALARRASHSRGSSGNPAQQTPIPPSAGWALAAVPLATAPALPEHVEPTPIAAFPSLVGDTARAPTRRWSGDAWLLLRQDTTRAMTSGRGSYGQSQAGAVLRYRLAPRSGHRPTAYLRASTALGGTRDAELALGFAARPVPGVPLVLAAEVRGAHAPEGTQARPAAFAYSELPPFKLPFGARGEAYLQGGWVGGRFTTPFVDGQVRIDREIARLGPAGLRAGAGVWGGAQKGANRIDVGPGATVAVEVAGAPLRMSADWRFRVAGEAHPHSGPALTISIGF